MTGDGSGTRVAIPLDRAYGMYQVDAIASDAIGVVSAFYTRSDYDQETRDFSEIDVEFLNGRPGVPGGVWLNSFENGLSNGETLLKPAQYQRLLGSQPGTTTGRTWTTYTIDWTPDAVRWSMNGTVVQDRRNGQAVTWTDMNGVVERRAFRSPTRPSHVTFSIWTAATPGTPFQGFGGTIPAASRNRTFSTTFARHRRITCSSS